MILPGLVNAHSHLEYAVYAGFGDGRSVRRLARHAHRAQARARPRRDGRDRTARRRRLAGRGHHDHGRLQLLRRRGRGRGRARAAGDRLPRGLRRRARGRAAQFEGLRAARDETELVRDRHLARMRRTPARSTSTAGACRSASRSARTWPRATPRTSGSSTAPARSPPTAMSSSPPTGRRAVGDARGRPRPGASLRPLRRRRRRTRSPCSRAPTFPSCTARARTPCSAAGSRRSRDCGPQGSASGSAPTRPPRRRRSTRGRRCAPPST